jgi:hypothetical protein
MDQWWNDTDRGKPMYQDTNFHKKLFSCDICTDIHERMYGGYGHQSSVYGLHFPLYCTLCE